MRSPELLYGLEERRATNPNTVVLPETFNVDLLPTEILSEIFKNLLHQADLSCVSRVCQHWNTISLPMLYRSMDIGNFNHDPESQEMLIRSVNNVTLINPNLRKLIQDISFRITHIIRVKESDVSNPRIFPWLTTITIMDLNKNSNISPYLIMVSCCSFLQLKKLHVGLRGERASEGPLNLLVASGLINRLPMLEELRFSRIRTRSEALKIGGARDEDVVVADHLCESPTETEAELTLRSRDCLIFAETYIYHLAPMTSLKILDFDLGVTPDSFTDPYSSLSDVYTIIDTFLGYSQVPDYRAREKFMYLSHQQFSELARDVADEILRRAGDCDTLDNLPFLPPIAHCHHHRNYARSKLARFPPARIWDLATDIRFEMLRTCPRLSNPVATLHIFSTPDRFMTQNERLGDMAMLDLIRKIANLQAARDPHRDWELMLYLRDVHAYVVPLVYERLEEAGLRNVQTVRVRLFVNGPWIEVLVQRTVGGLVEVVSFLPDVVVLQTGGRFGIYLSYIENRRVHVDFGILEMVEGRWRLV